MSVDVDVVAAVNELVDTVDVDAAAADGTSMAVVLRAIANDGAYVAVVNDDEAVDVRAVVAAALVVDDAAAAAVVVVVAD